jgi:hypothetical protein
VSALQAEGRGFKSLIAHQKQVPDSVPALHKSAGRGVNLNQMPELSIQLDLAGNPIRDNAGRLQVRENALTLGSGYTTFNNPNNIYAGIVPPQTIAPVTINIPAP